MRKNLFQKTEDSVKKKRVFLLSLSLIKKLEKIELEAEKHGVNFPLSEHVEEAILRIVRSAENELSGLSDKTKDLEIIDEDNVQSDSELF